MVDLHENFRIFSFYQYESWKICNMIINVAKLWLCWLEEKIFLTILFYLYWLEGLRNWRAHCLLLVKPIWIISKSSLLQNCGYIQIIYINIKLVLFAFSYLVMIQIMILTINIKGPILARFMGKYNSSLLQVRGYQLDF